MKSIYLNLTASSGSLGVKELKKFNYLRHDLMVCTVSGQSNKNTSILVTFVFSYSPALQCVMIVDGL